MPMFITTVGLLTIPIWAIVFCLNLITILEKVKNKKGYAKNKFWFTTSFVFIVSTIAYAIVLSTTFN